MSKERGSGLRVKSEAYPHDEHPKAVAPKVFKLRSRLSCMGIARQLASRDFDRMMRENRSVCG